MGHLRPTFQNISSLQFSLTIAQLKGMPSEMLDRAYNLYGLENCGINLDDHPEYRSYQPFYEMGIAPPTHQEMVDIIMDRRRKGPR